MMRSFVFFRFGVDIGFADAGFLCDVFVPEASYFRTACAKNPKGRQETPEHKRSTLSEMGTGIRNFKISFQISRRR